MTKISKKTIRNIEWCDNVPDGASVRVARYFLIRLLSQVCDQAKRYYEEDSTDYFLRFPERMMYSQFAAAIQKLTPLHASEHSISRNSKGESSSGRADFWAYYRQHDILLELKRQSMKLRGGVETKRIADSLALLVTQTKSLKRDAKGWGGKSALIGLEVILPYSKRRGKARAEKAFGEADPVKLSEDFRRQVLEHDAKPNFVATWVPPPSMHQFETESSGEYELNPFIGFVGFVVTIR
ncbi:MAG: hypothetical protein ACRD22_19620 [Terriglobia bacterium]